MRLRLLERFSQLGGWLFGSRGERSGRSRDPRAAAAEASGRHRRVAGGGPPPGPPAAGTAPPRARPLPDGARRVSRDTPGPPAPGLPRRSPQATGAVPRTTTPRGTGPLTGPRADAAALPPLPRNYTPGQGGASQGGGQGGGIGRARIREAPFGAAPADTVTRPPAGPDQTAAGQAGRAAPRQPWYQIVGGPPAARRQAGPAGVAAARNGVAAGQAAMPPARELPAEAPAALAPDARALLPYAKGHPDGHPVTADGRRNCGPLEAILWRQWDPATTPPPQVAAAIDRLAEFPRALQEKLSLGLDGIYVGDGGVPDLDDMAALHNVPLPSGKATWDACAGAYGDRKIVVGTRPSPTPDVMCHEVGHALDDLDSPPGKWQSDSAEFRLIYDQCQPYVASDFHRQRGGLGRKEFFADAFAAIASAQRPALVDMLSGNTRIALRVMLYFNRRYGI
jgi:hypothetical protein